MSLILRSQVGRRLTISEMDGNFTYLENLAQSGGGGSVKNIGNADDNINLLTTDFNIFVSVSTPITINMASPADMPGETVRFVRKDQFGEVYCIINGTFGNGSSTYYLYGYSYNSVTFLSDGESWYVVATT